VSSEEEEEEALGGDCFFKGIATSTEVETQLGSIDSK
jgi:hypothetical protein